MKDRYTASIHITKKHTVYRFYINDALETTHRSLRNCKRWDLINTWIECGPSRYFNVLIKEHN